MAGKQSTKSKNQSKPEEEIIMSKKRSIGDLISFLDEQTEAVTEYSEPLARRLIEKITVYDEKLVVEFKSGLTVEVEA